MSAPAPATAEPENAGVPYVGLRPYGPEERDLFFGRNSDAQFLEDKILSARITLLYAPSGIGKSSLLRAKVIPALEKEDCHVLYFDSWAGAEPALELKNLLAKAATAAGIIDPLAGAPTIAELVQLRAADGKTTVLVLDQFEEFLINHASDLDPLRKEIAALVRSQIVDARVVISLREEFLAAIEPFRQDILTLFASTYRLEYLPPAEVLNAIVKPAERCGGEVEAALADRLVADMSEVSSTPGLVTATPANPAAWTGLKTWLTRLVDRFRGQTNVPELMEDTVEAFSSQRATAGTIDLPMLQLVCEHMWRAAPIVEGKRKLTLKLYQELGGRRRILDRHIRSRMPESWRDRLFTATLMKFLAPPSGLKISYSAADLAAYCGERLPRVEAELTRLSGRDSRILRQRKFRDSVRFELQHDALIRHIAPWRDAVLSEAAAMDRLKWVAGVAALIVVFLLGRTLYHQGEVRRNTDDKMRNLNAMGGAERTFESVASYLLFQERGEARFDHLKRLLVANEKQLPEDYGTGGREVDFQPSPARESADSVAMRFSSDLALDVESFRNAWSDVAHRFSSRWGIPMSSHVNLIEDADFPRAAIQFEWEDDNHLQIDLEVPEGKAIVSITEDAPEAVRDFHRKFLSDWKPLVGLETGARKDTATQVQWWAVPRWSLPAWRAAGLQVWSASAYPALALQVKLDQKPTMLLTSAAVQSLVHRVSEEFPCTAAEVWEQRNESLGQDLAAWIGTDKPRPIRAPHLVFDMIANLRSATPEKQTYNRSSRYVETLDKALSDPWPTGTGTVKSCELPTAVSQHFASDAAWLPPLEPRIRVALSRGLVSAWTRQSGPGMQAATAGTPSETDKPATPPEPIAASPAAKQRSELSWSAELAEALEQYRLKFYKRSGIWLPDVTWSELSEPSSGGKLELRIMLFDDEQVPAVDARSAKQEGIDRFIEALDRAVSKAKLAWVDTELAEKLVLADEGKRNRQILDHLSISLTDLKLLLRAMLTNPGASHDESIRDVEWLIPSLVFWKAYYTHAKAPTIEKLLPDLAGGLRRLQAHRNSSATTSALDGAAQVIQNGIQALDQGAPSNAERSFEDALNRWPRADVENLFVERYAARWKTGRRNRTENLCKDPTSGTLDQSLRIEVEDWLQDPESRQNISASRKLALCLLSSMPATARSARTDLSLKIATQYGDPKDWSATDARWIAEELLDQYNPVRDPAAVKEQGSRFLAEAIRKLPSSDANLAVNKLIETCNKPGPANWCWELLPRIAELRPDPWTSLDIASALTNMETVKDIEQGLSWLDRAQSQYAGLKSQKSRDQNERFAFWASYVRTSAADFIASLNGDSRKLDEALRSIPSIVDSSAVKSEAALEPDALSLAIRVHRDAPKPDRARIASYQARILKDFRTNPITLSRTTFDAIRDGDTATVVENVKLASESASASGNTPEMRAESLFIAAVGGLLTKPGAAEWNARQFIRTGHLYAPVVSMMLIARSEGIARDSANAILAERWNRADRTGWDKRLREGDRQAWYEMIVGYFVGKVGRDEIFGPLRDESTLAASPLAGLRVPLKGLLTEAWFYDALRLQAARDTAGANASLRQVVDLKHTRYIEYDLATQLLRENPTKLR